MYVEHTYLRTTQRIWQLRAAHRQRQHHQPGRKERQRRRRRRGRLRRLRRRAAAPAAGLGQLHLVRGGARHSDQEAGRQAEGVEQEH